MSLENVQGRSRSSTALAVLAWGAFGLAVATNVWGLYAPSQPGPSLFPGFDKIAHLGSFALLAFTGLLAGIRPRPLLIVLALHAVLSEVLQAAVLPDRSGDVADLGADLAGLVLGTVTWWAVVRLRRRMGSR